MRTQRHGGLLALDSSLSKLAGSLVSVAPTQGEAILASEDSCRSEGLGGLSGWLEAASGGLGNPRLHRGCLAPSWQRFPVGEAPATPRFLGPAGCYVAG